MFMGFSYKQNIRAIVKCEENKLFGRIMLAWKNNIKVELKEIFYEEFNSVTLALKVYKGRVLNTVINFGFNKW